MADVYPGCRVLEAGTGSGALTLALLRAVGPEGRVITFEQREEFARRALANIHMRCGEVTNLTMRLQPVEDGVGDEEPVDRVVLDLPEPWRLTQAVARVYETLSPEDKARAAVLAQDYGQAGAINHFGPALGIPRAVSGHNSYYLWGPGDATGEVVIVIGDEKEDLQRGFEQVEAAGITDHPWARPDEVGLTIWICRKPRRPLEELWPLVRSYD